jgi:hypothetical protein
MPWLRGKSALREVTAGDAVRVVHKFAPAAGDDIER